MCIPSIAIHEMIANNRDQYNTKKDHNLLLKHTSIERELIDRAQYPSYYLIVHT
jgi:DNA polymerase III alpha subunit